jgi:hypothetical protein
MDKELLERLDALLDEMVTHAEGAAVERGPLALKEQPMFSDDEYRLAGLACQVASAVNGAAAAFNAVVGYEDREEGVAPEECINKAFGLLKRARKKLQEESNAQS